MGRWIGKEISKHAQTVLETVLETDIKSGRIILKHIKGLTIENRVAANKASQIQAELKQCDVILKAHNDSTKGDKWPNITQMLCDELIYLHVLDL